MTQNQHTNPHAGASGGVVKPILMPLAGQTMEEGTIVKWRVQPGEVISVGDIIFEVETDKATVEVEAVDSGRLARIVVPEGQAVAALSPVAYLAENDADVDAYLAREAGGHSAAAAADQTPESAPGETPKPAVETPAVEAPPPAIQARPAGPREGGIKASPAARRIARERGIDLASIASGSGPGGRIVTADLEKTQATAAEPVRRKMSPMRKAIARNVLASKQGIPHFYMQLTVDAGPLVWFYQQQKANTGCTINDCIVLACGRVLREFPALRSRVEGDEILQIPTANIGIAVGMDDGLVVPVIIGVDRMSLAQLTRERKRIVEAARRRKIENMGQGVMTISNLGMYGVEQFVGIINPPEAALLAVGAVREDVIVRDGAIRAGKVMTMTLSADHRVVDGMLASRFLAGLREILEDPAQLAY